MRPGDPGLSGNDPGPWSQGMFRATVGMQLGPSDFKAKQFQAEFFQGETDPGAYAAESKAPPHLFYLEEK